MASATSWPPSSTSKQGRARMRLYHLNYMAIRREKRTGCGVMESLTEVDDGR